jgi:hypothetical protein
VLDLLVDQSKSACTELALLFHLNVLGSYRYTVCD